MINLNLAPTHPFSRYCCGNETVAELNMPHPIMFDPKLSPAFARRVLPAVALGCALALGASAGSFAADQVKADTTKDKPMDMNEPMAGGMKKEGMKLGDVKKAAEKWDHKMRKMIEKEQPAGAAKK